MNTVCLRTTLNQGRICFTFLFVYFFVYHLQGYIIYYNTYLQDKYSLRYRVKRFLDLCTYLCSRSTISITKIYITYTQTTVAKRQFIMKINKWTNFFCIFLVFFSLRVIVTGLQYPINPFN